MLRWLAPRWLVLLGFLLPASADAQRQAGVPPSADAVIGRAAKAYAALNSLHADFVQVIDDEALGTFESKGSLVQSGQAKLAMRFSDPPGEAIVADGEHVWVYTPSTTPGQVLRMPLPSGPAYGFNVLSWILDRPAERYKATYLRADKVNGEPVDVVELIPKVPDLPFTRAVVWLGRSDGLPRKLKIEEQSGARRTITLSRVRRNGPVAPKTFTFDVPRGVRVVDQS